MIIYIYTLSHPITGEIKYVGKTVNPKQRKYNHTNKARDKNTHKRNWINSLRLQKLRPIFEIIDEVNDDWKFWERYWISQVRTWGFKLCNHTMGGDGLETGNQTSFKKGQLSWNEGTGNKKICVTCGNSFLSSVTAKKSNCSKECTSIYKSKNLTQTVFKKGFIPWNAGKKWYRDKEGIIQFNFRPREISKRKRVVKQINKNTMEIIKEYTSIASASIDTGIIRSSISNVLNGVAKTAGGYLWL